MTNDNADITDHMVETQAEPDRWDELAADIAERWIQQKADTGQPLDPQGAAAAREQAVFMVQAMVACLINVARFGHPVFDIVDALVAERGAVLGAEAAAEAAE